MDTPTDPPTDPPEFFELENPWQQSNSGPGWEDPEYTRMRTGHRMEFHKSSRCVVELLAYKGVRHTSQTRFGVIAYRVGSAWTVAESWRAEREARESFAGWAKRLTELPGGAR